MANMIRRMRISELDEIGDIWLQSNLEAHNFIDKNYWLDNLIPVKEQFKKADIFVYTENEKVLGFVGLQDNYIAGIFVKSEFRSHSIGRQLLDYLKNNYSNLSLDVYDKNSRAVKFYQTNDFGIVSTDIDRDSNEKEYRMSWSK